MSVPEPLRYSPFRTYRRKSLYTGLYGTNYSGPTRPPGDTTDSAGVPIQSRPNPSHKMYTSGFFNEYAPHPGPMEMPGRDYQPYDSSAVPHVALPSQLPALEPGRANASEPEVKYEDSLMDADFFKLQMELLREEFGDAALMEWDNNEVALHIMQARTETEEETSEFDDDLRAQMFEIQMAVEQVRAASVADSDPEVPSDSVYGPDAAMYQPTAPEPMAEAVDYEVLEPQDFFDQQLQAFESQFSQFDPAEFDSGAEMEAMFEAQEAMFDLPQADTAFMDQAFEGIGPFAGPGPESLEHIIETNDACPESAMPHETPGAPAYEDSLLTPELFEQGMDEVAEPMEAMEPYLEPPLPGYGAMPQEMYDEQEPEMMDPYMMPGMIDPYMMPGPFGPGPMLDPGPGGPP